MDVDDSVQLSESDRNFISYITDQEDDQMLHDVGETIEERPGNELEISRFGRFLVAGKIFPRKVGSETFLIAIFQGSESLFVRGAVDCRLIFGSATCFGFPLSTQYHSIVSSTTSGVVSIETTNQLQTTSLSSWYAQQSSSKPSLWTQEDQDLRLEAFIKVLAQSGSEEMANSIRAIVVLKKCSVLGIWPLLRDEILSKPKIMPKEDIVMDLEPTILMGRLEKGISGFLVSPSWLPLTASWQASVSQNEFMVCGKKHVGKSSLVRYIVNSLLAKSGKVVLLDCDLGQPELTAPGFVSMSVLTNPLLGPSFANIQLASPIWQESHFIGHVSAKDKLSDILTTSSLLFAKYKFSVEQQFVASRPSSGNGPNGLQDGAFLAPIVINTHGWVEGAGYEALISMMQTLAPAQLIQIIPHSEPLLFQPDECAPFNVSLLRLYPVVEHTGYATIQSTEKRQMQIMSSLSEPSRVTYRLPWAAFRIHLLDVEVPPSQWMYVLNGSMVALLVDSTPYTSLPQSNISSCYNLANSPEGLQAAFEHSSTTQAHQSSPPTARPAGIDPTLPEFLLERPSFVSSYCVGIGLITSIDMENCSFYLSTSVPRSLLLNVNTIVKGSIEIPLALLMATAIPATPYLTADSVSSQGTGSGTLSIRNNLARVRHQ